MAPMNIKKTMIANKTGGNRLLRMMKTSLVWKGYTQSYDGLIELIPRVSSPGKRGANRVGKMDGAWHHPFFY